MGDIAIAGDRIVGTHETYNGATEIDGRGLVAVPGFIDSPRPLRIHPGHAAGVRPLRRAARHDDGDLRSARDLQRAGHPGAEILPRVRGRHGHGPARAAFVVRAVDASRDVGRAAGGRGSAAVQASSQGAGAGRVHERAGRAQQGSGGAEQARRRSPTCRSTAIRRCCSSYDLNAYIAAGVRNCHETTSAEEAREKLAQGHADPGARGHGVQGSRGARRADHHRARAVPGASAPTTATRSTSPRRAMSTT